MNTKQLWRFLNMLVATCLIVFMCQSCSDSSDGSSDTAGSTATTEGSVVYKGPGSIWTLDISGDAFTLKDEADSTTTISAEGSVGTSATGFMVFTISASDGSGGPAVGAKIVGVDVPGIAFMLQPVGSGSEVITLLKYGTCPTANIEANWVKTKSNFRDTDLGNGDSDTEFGAPDAWLGQYKFDITSSVASLPASWSITNLNGDEFPVFNSTAEELGSGSCSNGILEITESSGTSRLFMTENGGAIADITGTQSIMGFTRHEISSADQVDGNYIGFFFFGGSGDVYKVQATSSSGTMTLDLLSADTETISQAAAATITDYQINTPSEGFVKVTLNTGNMEKLACNFSTNLGNSAKKILFCVGKGSEHKHKNVLLVSK